MASPNANTPGFVLSKLGNHGGQHVGRGCAQRVDRHQFRFAGRSAIAWRKRRGARSRSGTVRSACERRPAALRSIVATAAFTGARRNEILVLRWSDFDAAGKFLTIRRALEETRTHGVRYMEPKTARGIRTITLDDGLIDLLEIERERHLRAITGIGDGAAIDLSLVNLPEEALIFPSPLGYGGILIPRVRAMLAASLRHSSTRPQTWHPQTAVSRSARGA